MDENRICNEQSNRKREALKQRADRNRLDDSWYRSVINDSYKINPYIVIDNNKIATIGKQFTVLHSSAPPEHETDVLLLKVCTDVALRLGNDHDLVKEFKPQLDEAKARLETGAISGPTGSFNEPSGNLKYTNAQTQR